ncbi:MAG TPA: hypothetical protein VGQ39_04255 [Pyrinomonadaceae bacterium]|nr:hypothetical protein [Pyrinomonadaceae bacterium]
MKKPKRRSRTKVGKGIPIVLVPAIPGAITTENIRTTQTQENEICDEVSRVDAECR